MSWRIFRLVFQLGLLAAAPGLAWGQITLVNATTCSPRVFPAACTIPSTNSGNLLVIAFTTNASNTSIIVNSITDNVGNGYAEAGAARAIDTSLLVVLDTWYAKNSVPGATSIIITPSTSVNGTAVIWEFSGVDRTAPLDQTGVLNSQGATALVTGAPVAITSAAEVIISTANVSNSLTGISAGNTFTNDSTTFSSGWAHLITSAAGTYSAKWGQDAPGTYCSSTVSFKAAAASTPSFTLTAAPSPQTVTSGTNAVYTVTVAPSGGFTGAVALSISPLPQGVTASFSPASITTSGSSVLTVNTSSLTPVGAYPLTITGTSGSLTTTTTTTLGVSTTSTQLNSCDLTTDGKVDAADVQAAISMSLGTSPCIANIAGVNVCNVIVVQRIVNASQGTGCFTGTGLHFVTLTWSASAGAASYQVLRGTSPGGETLLASSILTPSYTDNSVVSGLTYYYVVRAVDSSGNVSPSSSEVPATIPVP